MTNTWQGTPEREADWDRAAKRVTPIDLAKFTPAADTPSLLTYNGIKEKPEPNSFEVMAKALKAKRSRK